MKPKKYSQRQKKHKPNLKGPYSVEPQDKDDTDFPDEAGSKKSKKGKKQDPAIIDRQE
ncbi:MAG TPA: hypothetical protein VL443_05265 [Cyclobacteriaceae bacterium]|jgi:hypothetical protein|nr:hypothetical protein [Cyclobacteriaceae bacterium]